MLLQNFHGPINHFYCSYFEGRCKSLGLDKNDNSFISHMLDPYTSDYYSVVIVDWLAYLVLPGI